MSLVDTMMQLWHLVTYNHNILNLDRKDCLNPAALAWYKKNWHTKTIQFPLDEALEYDFDISSPSKITRGKKQYFLYENL
jgi:hypothetical protein